MQEKEDQVRWKDASVYPLYQLQDGVCVHAGGEEEKSTERVFDLSSETRWEGTLISLQCEIYRRSRKSIGENGELAEVIRFVLKHNTFALV